MLNEQKIKVMTRLAKCEKKEHRESFDIMNFYKYDYIRYNLLKTVIGVTVGYGMIVGLTALYHMEYLILNFVTLDYKAIVTLVLGGYLALLLIYSVATIAGSSGKYDKSRKEVGHYYRILEVLQKWYSKDNESR